MNKIMLKHTYYLIHIAYIKQTAMCVKCSSTAFDEKGDRWTAAAAATTPNGRLIRNSILIIRARPIIYCDYMFEFAPVSRFARRHEVE